MNRSAVLTVGPTGADCSSIQAAVNCAPAGAKILVAPGSYHEQVLPCCTYKCSVHVALNCQRTLCSTVLSNVALAHVTRFVRQVVLNKTGIQLLGQAQMAIRTSAFSLPSSQVVVTWHVPNQPVLNITHDDVIISNVTSFNDANHFQIGKNSALYITSGDRTAVFFSSFFGAQVREERPCD